MNKPKSEGIEVNSVQLDGRLVRIEDRIAGVEALLAYVNRSAIESLIADAVGNSIPKRTILRLCEEPQSIPALQKVLDMKSPQAVSNHLGPLKDHGLLQHASTSPQVTYEWTAMIRRLSKVVRDQLLRGPQT